MQMSASKKRTLNLSFDINETIIVGDPAGGDTFEESLNKIICKVAFVRPRSEATGEQIDYEWHDGSSFNVAERNPDAPPPPLLEDFKWPEGCTPFYRVESLKAKYAKVS